MKNAFRRILALGLAVCLAFALAACGGGGSTSGSSLAGSADDNVIDEAGVLSDDTKAIVFNISKALEERCGAQIGVYTVEYIGNTTIEALAYRIGNEWGLGDAEKNNGILLLLAVGDDNYYMTRGSGLESQISALSIDSLLHQNMEPSWVQQDYDTGTCKTVMAIAQQLCRIYGLTMDLEAIAYGAEGGISVEPSNSGGAGGGSFLTVLLVLLAIVLVIWLIGTLSRRKRRGPPPPPAPPAGNDGYHYSAYPNTYATRRRSSFGSGFASGVGFSIGQNVGRRIFGGSRRPPSPPPPPPPSGGYSAPPQPPRSSFGGSTGGFSAPRRSSGSGFGGGSFGSRPSGAGRSGGMGGGVRRSGGSFRAGGGSFRGGGAGRRK